MTQPTVPTTIPGLIGGLCLILFVLPFYWTIALSLAVAAVIAGNPIVTFLTLITAT